MPAGMSVALMVLAQAASAAPPAATPAPAAAPPPATAPRPDGCRNPPVGTNSRSIVVCAPKPQGYRIDPDVLEAQRERHGHSDIRPLARQTINADECSTVGPMGCRFGPTLDFLSAAAVLAKIGQTVSQGGDVGKIFETDPQTSEYQLYLQAKKRREAREAQAAAAAAKAKALAPKVTPAKPSVGPPAPPPAPAPAQH